ncbi:phospholipase A2 [Streptomyces sp. NPDC057116]|uniref:phospholipase A2 n=1 Tax=Streptomyces sp. NPDC057116 TaxID=3346023 RepID=UPI00362B362E
MRRKLSTTLAALALTTTTAATGVVATAGTAAADHDTRPAATALTLVLPVAAPTVREQADRIMNLTYREFARTPRVAPFNWTTDGCSVPTGYAPYSEVFRPACVQHDFGYRNYGANHELRLSPTRETKNWIDGRFRTEMERVCQDTYLTPLRHLNCVNAAQAYYLAVSVGGDRAFF